MEKLIQTIVKEAKILKDEYTDQIDAPVNYACIFCQTEEEQRKFLSAAHKMGVVIMETPSGILFKIDINTVAGRLRLLKVRKPDLARPERGDADFTVGDYPSFKEKYLHRPGFKLILKENFEMIELSKKGEPVRVYFSFPPLDKQLGL